MDKATLISLYGHTGDTVNDIRKSNPQINAWITLMRRRDNVEDTTIRNMVSQLCSFIEYIAHSKGQTIDQALLTINAQDLEQYWDMLKLKHSSPAKLQIKVLVIRSFFERMLKRPMGLEQYKITKQRKKILTMEADEIPPFMKAVEDIGDKIFYSLLIGSGLRRGEAKYLYLSNIDFRRKLIHIRITDLYKPKEAKERITIISDETIRLIRQYIRPRPAQAKWEPLLLLNAKGKPLSMSTMRSRFLGYCRKAKIRANLSMHKLRSTFASLMIRQGYTLEQVHILLGHADIRTTERFYAELSSQINIEHARSPLDEYGGKNGRQRKEPKDKRTG